MPRKGLRMPLSAAPGTLPGTGFRGAAALRAGPPAGVLRGRPGGTSKRFRKKTSASAGLRGRIGRDRDK